MLALEGLSDSLVFGHYPQKKEGKPEPIEWLVLAKEADRILVISKYALDCQQYNTEYTGITWENCSLRNWLNGTFVKKAFSEEERSRIPKVTVTADKNQNYNTNAGKDTEDQVFLLSIAEANRYFASNAERQCKPTAYAIAQGCYVDKENGSCWWWLRSRGNHSNYAAHVNYGGSVSYYGHNVTYDNDAVRPALWINPGS